MRIWSVHPKHLDRKALVSLWHETLLAKHVLLQKTSTRALNPQLTRFNDHPHPIECIHYYLSIIYHEGRRRGYEFKREKISHVFREHTITITDKQIAEERKYLLKKLERRDLNRYHELLNTDSLETHPLFKVVSSEVENLEMPASA